MTPPPACTDVRRRDTGMAAPQPDEQAHVYVVRIWTRPALNAVFQASARRVESETVSLFGDESELARFLGRPAPTQEDR